MAAMDVKYKPVMFPNGGSVKKVKQAAVAPAMVGLGVGTGAGEVAIYRECLKNHAATLGGHALDGCGEFMATLSANPADPSTFTCAACGCHRNFHRRMIVEGSPPPPALPMPPTVLHAGQHLHRGEETPEDRLPAVDADESDSDSDGSEYDEERSVSPPPPLIPIAAHHPAPVAQQPPPPPYFASGPHMLLSLSSSAPGAAGAAQRIPAQVSPATAPPPAAMPARKRFRTKFTAEQKQRMQELSERLGWRLQKRDEAIVDEWCRDIGVSKGVFKVWMHNNKHNYLGGHSARRSASAAASSAATTPTGPAAPGPFHLSAPAAAAPAPFNPSATRSSLAPTTTGFNMNGTASSAAPTAPTATAAHPENGTSSQSA